MGLRVSNMLVKGKMVVGPTPVATSSDVTPNPLNWGNTTYNGLAGIFVGTTQQIQGISTSITIKVQYNSPAVMSYIVDNTLPDYSSMVSPSFIGFTFIGNNGTFTVNNNQYVSFCIEETLGASINYSQTITIKNNSDSDTILDTFSAIVTGME